MIPGISNTKALISNVPGTFVVEANGTKFYVSVKFINDRGQSKVINKNEFSELSFESVYTSPFVMGRLQLIEIDQQNKLKPGSYQFSGSGGEFIHIKIQQQLGARADNRITILNHKFIVKNIVETTTGKNIPMLNYYFADIEFGALSYNRLPWSTVNMLSNGAQLNENNKKVYVSDAISNLLTSFCKNENYDIIDTNNWDPSSTRIEYTLHHNQSPLTALHDLMSSYVSRKDKNMGLLLRQGGKFKLLSLDSIFKHAPTPIASVMIHNNDNRTYYTNNQDSTYFSRRYQMIPVHISDVQYYPKNPDTAVDVVVDHSIISYDSKNKGFNIYNQPGSITNLKNTFNDILLPFPGSQRKEVDVDKSNITKPNKNLTCIHESSNNSEFLGKSALQYKLINSADRISFNIPGSFLPSGGKFIGIELTGLPMNPIMKNMSGSWFVLQSTTTLAQNGFRTFLVNAKLDKQKL